MSFFMLLCSVLPLRAQEQAKEPSLDMEEYIFGHISDAYEWHLLTFKGKEVAIPLPCIVFNDGLQVFSSELLAHGAEYNGLRIAARGEPHEGKIVRVSDGGRPFDISITKNVLGLMADSLILVVLILLCCIGAAMAAEVTASYEDGKLTVTTTSSAGISKK